MRFGSITLTALLPFDVDYQVVIVCPIILVFLATDYSQEEISFFIGLSHSVCPCTFNSL